MFLVILACLAFFSFALTETPTSVAWPTMHISFGQPISAAGLIPPVGIAATLISTVLAGRLVTRLGVGRLLAASTVLSTIGVVAGGLSPNFWMFLGSIVGVCLASGAIDTSINSFAARRFGARQINLLHASYGVGAVVSPLIVTAVLTLGMTWRWAYLIVGVLQAGLSIVFIASRRKWLGGLSDDHRAGAVGAGGAARWSRRVVINTVVGLVTVGFQTGIESCAALWAYTFLTGAARVAPGPAGLVASGYWATMVVGRIVLGSLAERIGAWRILGLGVLGLLAASALVIIGSPATAIIGIISFGLATAPIYPLLILTTAERTSTLVVEQVVGLQGGASSVGAALIPPAVGLLMGRSLELFAPSMAVLSVIALVLQMIMRAGRKVPIGPARRHRVVLKNPWNS